MAIVSFPAFSKSDLLIRVNSDYDDMEEYVAGISFNEVAAGDMNEASPDLN